MCLRKVALAVFVLLLGIVPRFLSAQVRVRPSPTCLEQAAKKIRPNSKVTIFKLNGEKHIGLLHSVDLGNSHLLLKGFSLEDFALILLRQVEIAKIQYSKRGKFQPGFMAVGFLLGGLAGAGIGSIVEGPQEEGGFLDIPGEAVGFVVGAGIGLLGGAIIPMVLPSNRTIKCK